MSARGSRPSSLDSNSTRRPIPSVQKAEPDTAISGHNRGAKARFIIIEDWRSLSVWPVWKSVHVQHVPASTILILDRHGVKTCCKAFKRSAAQRRTAHHCLLTVQRFGLTWTHGVADWYRSCCHYCFSKRKCPNSLLRSISVPQGPLFPS
jgi:hypothetical protein